MKEPGIFVLLLLGATALAQSGGTYQMERSVISSGGGDSTGGTYAGTFTIGQPAAGGFLEGNPNQAYSGFWTPQPLAPTAASVTVSGRVRTANGRGIGNATLTITSQNGSRRISRSNSFGYYRFEGVAAGETYVVSISAKRFTFGQPTFLVGVFDEITNLDFVADSLP